MKFADATSESTIARAAKVMASLAIVTIVGILAAFAVVADVMQPDPICSACHPAQTRVQRGTVHASAGCYDCHARPGSLGRLARVSLDIAQSVSGMPGVRHEAIAVPSASCLKCHASILKVRVRTRGLAMDHGACLESETDCTDCHSDVGHKRSSPGRAINMDACSRCHDDIAAPANCDTCHEGDSQRTDELNAWAITHSANWLSTHGMGTLATCSVCHDERKCSKCHLPLPHPAEWARTHGAVAVEAGLAACTGCHQARLCEDCHGIQMPHPERWLAQHVADSQSKRSEDECLTCHSEADCTNCHEAHTHPGLSPERIKELTGQ